VSIPTNDIDSVLLLLLLQIMTNLPLLY